MSSALTVGIAVDAWTLLVDDGRLLFFFFLLSCICVGLCALIGCGTLATFASWLLARSLFAEICAAECAERMDILRLQYLSP